jgi:hypothetical protein
MSKTSKAVIEFSRENLLEQYLDLPEDQREQKFPTTQSCPTCKPLKAAGLQE